jgi:hypothetical protein
MNLGDQRRLQDLLAERLLPVTRRLRRVRLLQGWLVLAAATALVSVILRLLEERRGWHVGAGWPLLLAAALGAAIWIRRRSPGAVVDARLAAQLIEAQSPELRALLLTAVAQTEAAPAAGLSYLQEQVIRAAVDRSAAASWDQAISSRKLRGLTAGCAAAALLVLCCAVTGLAPDLPSPFDDGYGLRVTPGDTSVERGASLLVLARFARRAGSGVELVVQVPGAPPLRLPMRRNLEDPVWATLIPAVARDATYVVEHDGGRSPRYHVDVFEAPRLERLDARIEYPQQPALPARHVTDARFLSVLEGARVTITARLGGPAGQVQLVPEARPGTAAVAPLPLTSAGRPARQIWHVVLTPTISRRYDLRITDDQGRTDEAPPRLSLEVHRNLPPEVRLVFPGRDVRVSPIEEMTVEAKISDDTAVQGYGVTYRRAGQPARELRLGGVAQPPATQVTARAVIELEPLGVQPAELITYHFWAEDRDGAGKLRRTAGDMYFAEVRPFEERYREQSGGGDDQAGDQAGGAAAAEQIRQQKALINATWKIERGVREVEAGAPLAPLDQDAAVVAKEQTDLAAATAALRGQARDARTRAALDAAVSAMNAAKTALAQVAGMGGRTAALSLEPLGQALEAEQRAYAALLRLRDDDHNVAKGRRGQGGGQGEDEAPALAGLELKQKESRYETRSAAGKEARSPRPKREALGRLDELARRQKALTERLREATAAIDARAPQDPTEAQRRLQRLREEQQELIEDLDQLSQRLAGANADEGDNAAERQTLERTRAELENSRKEAAAASEALAKGESGRALGASARAERRLEEARRDLGKDVAAGFDAEMRGLRDATRALDEREQTIARALEQSTPLGAAAGKGPKERATGLQGDDEGLNPTEARRLAGELRAQKEAAQALLERVEAVSGQAEAAAPLLSRKLYDGLREAKSSDLESALGSAGDLLERNLADDGRAAESRARRAVADLRGRIDEAAQGVLGDEAAALRAAQSELDGLIAEAAQENAAGPGTAPGRSGRAPASPSSAGAPASGAGPITGTGFRAFAERLRDVEDLLDDSRLRNQAAAVRDRARALRGDWKQRGQRPEAAVLEKAVLAPLTELRLRVSEQLGRLDRNDKLVPLDRDPIPARYTDLVRRYWKSLSEGRDQKSGAGTASETR